MAVLTLSLVNKPSKQRKLVNQIVNTNSIHVNREHIPLCIRYKTKYVLYIIHCGASQNR